MLSAHQIYKENTDVTTNRNVKTNANAKPRGLGLKNSTNICHNQKSNSSSLLDPKKNSNILKKNVLKQELKSSVKEEKTSVLENLEEWPETENMYIYNDSDGLGDTLENIDVLCKHCSSKVHIGSSTMHHDYCDVHIHRGFPGAKEHRAICICCKECL